MAGIFEIITEQEEPGGWVFAVQEIRPDGALHAIRLALSWQDYDLFCPDGAVPPEGVARAVVEIAFVLWPDGIPNRLDASTLRRKSADADERVINSVDMRAL